MTSLERLTGRITSRIGLIVVFAILLLAVSSTAGRDAIDASVTAIATVAAQELSGDTSIRPFKFTASDQALTDLRRRVAATKWPDRETVTDTTQGVQLATMQQLARDWGKEYDWRKAETKLNAYPQFITNIDGLDIHFIHVRSMESNALPVIITHGWPGSVIEQIEDHRAADQSDGAWRDRLGRVRRRHPVVSRLRLLRQADGARMDARSHRPRLGDADAAPRLHTVRGAGRRLGECSVGADGPAGIEAFSFTFG